MIELAKITLIKKGGQQLVHGRLDDGGVLPFLESETAQINKRLLMGYEIINSVVVEDLKGKYLVYTLFKKPRAAGGEESK